MFFIGTIKLNVNLKINHSFNSTPILFFMRLLGDRFSGSVQNKMHVYTTDFKIQQFRKIQSMLFYQSLKRF